MHIYIFSKPIQESTGKSAYSPSREYTKMVVGMSPYYLWNIVPNKKKQYVMLTIKITLKC